MIEKGQDQKEVKRSLTNGHGQISQKAGCGSDVLSHQCNKETSENKVSLIHAQNALQSSS